ncbi:MAG TPA: PucR family transcriptional regulator [Elainellaceae cyanobacterium]
MNPFTVRQALDLPIFASSQLVAGKKGLDNSIHWVHVVDITHAHYQWDRKGVLLLTSGLGLRENPNHQKSLVNRLTQLRFAGLVLSTGHYFDHTPDIIRHDADRLGLPVIETPPDVLFIQITEAILERIVNRHYALLQQSAHINQQLTNLVLQGASLHDLAATLAELLQRAIAIESPTFQLLAVAPYGLTDQAWEQMISQGRSMPDIIHYLVDVQAHEQLIQTLKPQHLPPNAEVGMTMGRVIAPIVVNPVIYGYVWLIVGDQPLTPLDERALDHGATVAALILVKEQAVRNVEDTLHGDFFTQLLEGNSPPGLLHEQAQRLNYRLDQSHQVVLVRYATSSQTAIQPLQASIRQRLAQLYRSFLLVGRDDHFIIVLECNQPKQGRHLADDLLTTLSQPTSPLIIGIGTVCPAGDTCSNSVRQSYEHAQEAVQIGILLKRHGAIAFEDLGLLHWLYHLPPTHRANNLYLHHVRTLTAHDQRRGAQLLDTLETYLDRGCAIAEAADALFIHRNTLLHRLERIESLCDLNLRDAIQCLNLNVAIKSYRLHG